MAAASFAAFADIFIRSSGSIHAGAGPTGRGVAAAGRGKTEASRRTGRTRGVLP